MHFFSFIHIFFFSVGKSSKMAKIGKNYIFTPGGRVKKMQVKSRRCWEGLMAHLGATGVGRKPTKPIRRS